MLNRVVNLRQCWICFGEEVDSGIGAHQMDGWVRPCNCRGSTKWVHQSCLLSWIDLQYNHNRTQNFSETLNQDNNEISSGIRCPQCNFNYKICEKPLFEMPEIFVELHNNIKRIYDKILILSTVGMVLGSLYVTTWTYGAFILTLSCRNTNGQYLEPLLYLMSASKRYNAPTVSSFVNCFLGIPLIPIFVLSSVFPSFMWSFPLLPVLFFSKFNVLDIFSWPPQEKTLAYSIPFLISVRASWTGENVSKISNRIVDYIFFNSTLNSNNSAKSLLTPNLPFYTSTLVGSPSSSSHNFSQDEINEDDDWEQFFSDDDYLKSVIYSAVSALLFPIFAASAGYVLFASTKATVHLQTDLCGFRKTFLTGIILLGIHDAWSIVSGISLEYKRRSRHVLDKHNKSD